MVICSLFSQSFSERLYVEVSMCLHFKNYPAWLSVYLNIHIYDGFKKCPLLVSKTKMVLRVVWFLYHFTLESKPSVNWVWVIAFVNHLTCKKITGAKKLPIVRTKTQPKLDIWSLMIWSFSISCCNFFTSLILTK